MAASLSLIVVIDFKKMWSFFYLFHADSKTKSVMDFWIYSKFSKMFYRCFFQMIWVLGFNKQNVLGDRGCRTGGKWVAWEKGGNIEYLWHYATDCLHFFTMCLRKYRLLNKNYWNDLDIIDQDHSKCNVHNFADISSIFGPILTKFRPQWRHCGRH